MVGTAELEALFLELEPMLASIGIDTTPLDPDRLIGPIAEVERTLAARGLRLHPHVRWFWERWPQGAGEVTLPGFTDAAFAVSALNDDVQQFPFLLVVGYGSHRDLLVDLTREASAYIYVHDYFDDHGVQLIFTGFADLLRYLITFFDDAELQVDWDGPFNFVDRREHLSALLPVNVPEEERRPIQADVNTWPERWRTHMGVADDADVVRGATHTVAELIAARERGPVEATLIGSVKHLAGSANGILARLTDHTDSVEVLIPPSVPWFGESPSDTYELDIVANAVVGPEQTMDDFREDVTDIQNLALDGQIPEAGLAAAAMGHYIAGEHPIRVIARRPING